MPPVVVPESQRPAYEAARERVWQQYLDLWDLKPREPGAGLDERVGDLEQRTDLLDAIVKAMGVQLDEASEPQRPALRLVKDTSAEG